MRLQGVAISTSVIVTSGGVKNNFGRPHHLTETSFSAARLFGAVSALRKPFVPSELIREIEVISAEAHTA